MTDTLTTPVVTPTTDGEHERMAHIVGGWDLAEAIVNATPVVALCGKVWVPSRDPKKYPLCKTCVEIARANGWEVPNT